MGFDWHLPLQHRRILKLYHKICPEKRWRLSILILAPTWSAAIDLYQVVSCRRVINNTAKKLSLFWWQTVMKMTWSVGRPFQGEIFSDSNQRESFGGWLGRVKSDQLQMLRTTRTEDRRLGASPPNMWKRIDGMKQKGSFHWKYINLWEKKMKKIFTWSVDPAILASAPTGKWS